MQTIRKHSALTERQEIMYGWSSDSCKHVFDLQKHLHMKKVTDLYWKFSKVAECPADQATCVYSLCKIQVRRYTNTFRDFHRKNSSYKYQNVGKWWVGSCNGEQNLNAWVLKNNKVPKHWY